MPLIVCGVNHKVAPLSVRENWMLDTQIVQPLLKDLLAQQAVNEAVILSTCNRTEIYTSAHELAPVVSWLSEQSVSEPMRHFTHYCYAHQDLDMVRHVMRVANGLDSMVMGESQVFGQMKQAYRLAEQMGGVSGGSLRHLFQTVFAASKRIRHQTAIDANPVSLAYVAVQMAKRIFSDIKNCQVLFVGAGETIELACAHVYGQGCRQLLVANRTIERALNLSDRYHAHTIRIAEIPNHLHEVDMVITATGSQLPILGKGLFESALLRRKHRPICVADLGVPRDVEVEVGQLEDIYLYNLDDLNTMIQANRNNREAAAKQAEAMVETQALDYMRKLHVLQAGDMISAFREKLVSLSEQELARTLSYWKQTQNPQEALSYLTRNLINKVLHTPTIKLRQAAYEEKPELLLAAKDLFDL